MIGGLLLNLALGASRFGTADRGDARSLRSRRRRERFGGGLRLRCSIAATPGMPGLTRFGMPGFTSFGMSRLALAALCVTRLALTVARLALTAASRLAAAA